jgi:hypothetical protein
MLVTIAYQKTLGIDQSNMKFQMWHSKSRIWNTESQIWDVKCETSNVKCQMWNVKCEMWNLKCKSEFMLTIRLFQVSLCSKFEMWNMKCKMWNVKCECELLNMKFEMWNAKCQLWAVKCQMSNVKCELWNAKCELWIVKFQMSKVNLIFYLMLKWFISRLGNSFHQWFQHSIQTEWIIYVIVNQTLATTNNRFNSKLGKKLFGLNTDLSKVMSSRMLKYL